MSFPGGRQPGLLGTRQTPWEGVPMLLIIHIKCQPCCQGSESCYLSLGFLHLTSQVKVMSSALFPTHLKIRDQRNKYTQCKGNCTVGWAKPVWSNDPTNQWWFFWQQSPTDYCCTNLLERLVPRIWLEHSLVFSLFFKHSKDWTSSSQ